MKNLRNLLNEEAAAGAIAAGDVAGVRSPLFAEPIKREVPSIRKPKKRKSRSIRESLLFKLLSETSDETFKSIDVISKLKAAEKKFDYDKDSIIFGIEDEKGNTIKVYVRAAQAAQFEKTLSEILEDPNSEQKEVPEILFELKNKFEILHVDWGKVEEDEEEFKLDTTDSKEGDSNDELSLDVDASGPEGEAELNLDVDGSGEENVRSALDKVIDMMKADADARKAESQAKEAEARAKEAEYAAKAAETKMKSEEEVLDMEAHFKQKDDEKKEAKKLAKLAKYRHEVNQDDTDSDVTGIAVRKSSDEDM